MADNSADAITIRKYRDEDHAQVCQLFRDGMMHYPLTYPHLAPLHDVWESYVNMSLADDLAQIPKVYDLNKDESEPGIGCFWVAVDADNTVQGMVGFHARPELAPSKGELRRMAVQRSCKRTGLGRRLVQHLEDWARAHGFESVGLSTGAAMTDAVNFYSSLGYTVVRRARLVKTPVPGQPLEMEDLDEMPEGTEDVVTFHFERRIAGKPAAALLSDTASSANTNGIA